MIRRLRRGVATVMLATMLAAAVGCAPEPPPDAWVLSPVQYDNRMDGDEGLPRLIDTTYPMALASDTTGGFWGTSASSYLHVDAEGVAVRRFNLEPGMPDGRIAAVSPTVLVVSTGTPEPTRPGAVMLFDTEAMSWAEIHRDKRVLGDIAAQGDGVYIVVDSRLHTADKLTPEA